jgi:hypothetical protein
LFYLYAFGLRVAGGIREKYNFDLLLPFKRTDREQSRLLDLKANFFTQLSSQRRFRLFTGFEKASWNSPT